MRVGWWWEGEKKVAVHDANIISTYSRWIHNKESNSNHG